MTNAEYAQQRFWDTMERKLEEKGYPFFFSSRTHYAVINRRSAYASKPCVAIDFLVQKQIVRINVYIQNDVSLYKYLKIQKEQLEAALGFKCLWNENCTKAHTRRIEYLGNIRFNSNNINYDDLAEQTISVTEKFVKVFEKYL